MNFQHNLSAMLKLLATLTMVAFASVAAAAVGILGAVATAACRPTNDAKRLKRLAAVYNSVAGLATTGLVLCLVSLQSADAQIKTDDARGSNWVGIKIQSVTDELVVRHGLPNKNGAYVVDVVKDGPAARAGMIVGDVITNFGGKPFKDPKDLARMVLEAQPQGVVGVTVIRGGQYQTLSLHLRTLPERADTVIAGGEIRGTVDTVEDGARVRIDLPRGSVVRSGDEVRIETIVPGVGLVEIKSRWRVTLIGEGFAIAEPEAGGAGTARVGDTAVVVSGQPAVTAVETGTPREPRLQFSAEQLTELQKAAEKGNISAMLMLGAYHKLNAGSSGAAAPRNIAEAARWYGMAAEKGEMRAMTALGFLNQIDRKNLAGAKQWFQKAAEKSDPAAMYALSKLLAQSFEVKDHPEIIRWLRLAAQNDHAVAAFELAEMYLAGTQVLQNSVEAVRWFRLAANKGITPAMVRLAGLYAHGNGVAKNMTESFRWFLKAAEGGYPYAMYEVGNHYLFGMGVTKNLVEAKRWYQKAAEGAEPEGMYGLAYLYDQGLGIARDPAVAADFMMEAIQAGSFQAAKMIMTKPWALNPDFRKELQKRLREAGLYNGKIDGAMGAETRRAIAELAKTAR